MFSVWSQQLSTFYLQPTATACPRYICWVRARLHMQSCHYIICNCQPHVSFVKAELNVCVPFVPRSMPALDRCSGSAVVVISLHVGWTNLSIQFLPLVFSPMREPSLFRLLSFSASDKTLLSERPCRLPIFYASLLLLWLHSPITPFFHDFLLFFYFSVTLICLGLHFWTMILLLLFFCF